MLLYHIDIQIKNSNHQFRLELEGDDRFSDEGDWSVWSPGEIYLGECDGHWELSTQHLTSFILFDKKMPSALKFWTWGDEYPQMLAFLYSTHRGAILDQRQTGWGNTTAIRGSWDYTWKVVQRFI